MSEFIEAILAPANLWLTVLLGLCALYWLIVIAGGLSPDAVDLDLDADGADAPDLDVDGADVDGETGGEAGGDGALAATLRFLNLDDVPLMIVLSVIVLAMWAISVVLYPVTEQWDGVWRLLLVVPIFLVAALIMKIVTYPVKLIYRRLREEEHNQATSLELIGKVCRVTSSEATPRFGRAEFATDGAPIVLNVRTKEDATIERGREAVIVGRDEARGVYIIRAF